MNMPGHETDSRRASRRFGVIFLMMGFGLCAGAWFVQPGVLSGLRFSSLGALAVPARHAFFILALIPLSTGAAGLCLRRTPARFQGAGLWLNGIALVMALLVWVGMGRRVDAVGLMTQSLRLATPIALGAMAGILCERSGVINIAIEGMMLTGACLGFMAALYSRNVWIGLAAAVAGGMIMAALHAALSISLHVDQIISGTVVNILAVGGTGFIRRAFLTHNPLEAPGVFPVLRIPWLSDIPALGRILFSHQPMVYAMLLLAPLMYVALHHTRWGLRTRAVGQYPRAADTLGVNVFLLRYVNVILGGGLAGMGGAWFSLETVGRFDEIMTGGKGFIALAAMIFGKWNPVGAFGGALLFGSADAFQIKCQIAGIGIPYQFLSMAPYLITMVVLAGIIGRASAPAAVGETYQRGS